jgi:hypothetical protein
MLKVYSLYSLIVGIVVGSLVLTAVINLNYPNSKIPANIVKVMRGY